MPQEHEKPDPWKTYWFVEAFRDGQATGVWLDQTGRGVTRDPLKAMRFTDKVKALDSAGACFGAPLFDIAQWKATDHLFWPPPEPEGAPDAQG